jgi:hypothetical protein
MEEFPATTTKVIGPVAIRVLGWIAAAVGGAMLMLMLNFGSTQRQLQEHDERITKIELNQHEMSTSYATNKRVDDLQAETRLAISQVSNKLDDIVNILMENRTRK